MNVCYGFSQDCPCIKAAVIGTNVNVSVTHNNKVTAMDDTEINRGESVELRTVESVGKTTWYHGQQELSNTTVSPVETTEYLVKSSLKGCPDVYDKVVIKVAESTKARIEENIAVYPNPTGGQLNIRSSNGMIRNIQITNISGNVVMSRSYNDYSTYRTLNVSALKSGLHFIKIVLSDNTSAVKKIIKQ
jgi:hypothetical protein